MASFDRTFSASPVLVMPSQSAHQSPFGAPVFTHQSPSFGTFSAFVSHASLPQSYVSPSSCERRGHKRSRDEASENLDDRASSSTQLKQSEAGWVGGPNISPRKPGAEHTTNSSTQLGTWVDENTGTEKAQSVVAVKCQEQDKPSLRSHKSQRLDLSSCQDFLSNRCSPTRLGTSSITPVPSTSLEATDTPVVDDFTLVFGIGWRLLNAESSISAAVRGWARYIENHYPVTKVRIHAESKGLLSYLVQANEGWFLFDENLRQGRLVSTDNQRCIENLKSSPPAFEGTETMTASSSPRAVSSCTSSNDLDTEMN